MAAIAALLDELCERPLHLVGADSVSFAGPTVRMHGQVIQREFAMIADAVLVFVPAFELVHGVDFLDSRLILIPIFRTFRQDKG